METRTITREVERTNARLPEGRKIRWHEKWNGEREEASEKRARMAWKRLADIEKQKLEEAGDEPVPIVLPQAVDQWFQHLDERIKRGKLTVQTVYGHSSKRCDGYRGYLDQLILALGEDKPVCEITEADMEQVISILSLRQGKPAPERTRRRETPTSGTTLLKKLFIYRKFFRWCQTEGRRYAIRNPVARFLDRNRSDFVGDWNEDVAAGRKRARIRLTHNECVRLLEACRAPYPVDLTPRKKRETRKRIRLVDTSPPPYLFVAVLLGLRAGLRLGNVCGPDGVRWGDFDLAEGTLHVDRGRMRKRSSADDSFFVPIHPELTEALRVERARIARETGRMPRDEDRVIPVDDLHRTFAGALRRADLERKSKSGRGGDEITISFHKLRHTFLSDIKGKAPGGVVQRLADHSSSRGMGMSGEYAPAELEACRPYLEMLPWFFPAQTKEKKARRKA